MEKGFYKYYTELPTWAKGLVAVAVVGGVTLIGYKLYKKLQEDKLLQNSNKTSQDSNEEYKKLLKKGEKLTHPEMVYQTASNSIVNLLSGCEMTQSEQDVVKTIKETVKKPIDWYFLVKTFGSQMVDDCGLGTGETPYALPELLKDQLGQGFYVAIPTDATNYVDLKNYLKTMGVTI